MDLTSEQKAQKIIELELEIKTGVLNLHGLGLSELPEVIQEMTWLRILNLGHFQYWDVEAESWKHTNHYLDIDPFYLETILRGSFSKSANIKGVKNVSLPTWIDQLECLEQLCLAGSHFTLPTLALPKLESIFLDNSPVTDLKALAGLSKLTRVSFDRTDVESLNPLINLSSLEHPSSTLNP